MKLTVIATFLLLLSGAILPACTNGVHVEKRPGADLSRFRTFSWADTEVKTAGDQNPLLRSSIAEATIRQAIETKLTSRGFRRVDDNPDFYVTTHLFVEQARRTVANSPGPVGFGGFPYLVRYRGLLLPVNYGA